MQMYRVLVGLVGVTAVFAGQGFAQEKVALEVVKYAGLKDAVLKNRGKVVLVDFWASY